jgi:two-component system sensor histidine kinase BaeS
VVVLLSLGLTLAVGIFLTRRSVEHASVLGLERQVNLLASREKTALLPFANLPAVRPFLEHQDERLRVVSLKRPSRLLTPQARRLLRKGRTVHGDTTIKGRRYIFAAKAVEQRAIVLLRPATLRPSDWHPFFFGLLIAGLIGALLAAGASLISARAIAAPIGRVAAASRKLAVGESPEPVPVEGAEEVSTLAATFNEMAAQLARARTAERSFLLSVSHELRTPLTAIRGYSEGLAEGAVEPQEAARVLTLETARLERLVQDLLDLARINRSEFAVERRPVDLAEAAREVVQRYEAQARMFGVDLQAAADGAAPAEADPDRLLQVASNLVENALRSTPSGGSVTVSAEPGALVVSDTGPGLAASDVARAFERFYLFNRHKGERRVGTGLGLAIVKELSEAMEGRVEVQSRPGVGTRFTVRLPTP